MTEIIHGDKAAYTTFADVDARVQRPDFMPQRVFNGGLAAMEVVFNAGGKPEELVHDSIVGPDIPRRFRMPDGPFSAVETFPGWHYLIGETDVNGTVRREIIGINFNDSVTGIASFVGEKIKPIRHA